MENPHLNWEWINHHWLLISLVYLPAFNGYLNAFVVFLKVMGWTRIAEFLGRFENAVKASVDSYKQGRNSNEKNDSISINGPGPDNVKPGADKPA